MFSVPASVRVFVATAPVDLRRGFDGLAGLTREILEQLLGTNSENDDVNNCYTISTIHVPSNDDIGSIKLGDEVFENPFASNNYIFETSPPGDVF